MLKNVILYCFILTCSCKLLEHNKSTTLRVNFVEDEQLGGNSKYFETITPIMFLDTLKKYPNEVFVFGTINNKNWYDTNLISTLTLKLTDHTLCGLVESSYNSKLYSYRKTTISEQARLLIEGINNRQYPPINGHK